MDLFPATLSKKGTVWLAVAYSLALLLTAGAVPLALRSNLPKQALPDHSLDELKTELSKKDFPDAPLNVATLSPPDFLDFKLTFDLQPPSQAFDLSLIPVLSLDLTPPDGYENAAINSWWNDDESNFSFFNDRNFTSFRPPLILSQQYLPPTYGHPQETQNPAF